MSKAKRKQNLREAKQKLEDEIQRRKSAAEGFTPITLTLTTSHPDDDQPAVSIFLPPPTLPMTPSLSTASTLVSPSFPSTPETVMEYGTGLAAPAAPTALAALATFGFEPQADDAEKSSREATSRRMAALHRSAAAMAAIASSSANVAKEELANLLAGLHGLNAQALLASDLLRPALTPLSTNTPRNVSSPSKMDRNAGLTTPPAVLARTPKTSWRMILPSPTTPTPVHASARIQARGSLTVAPAMFHGSARGVRNEPYARPQRVPKTQEVREVPTDAELVEAMKELDVSQPEVIRRQVATM
jgi:hypothetical protein